MKTLAQYLAEYVETEMDRQDDMSVYDTDDLKEWIKQGIDAYQSTENCTITITEQTQQEDLLLAAREIVSDFNRYGEVLQVACNGEYGTESAIGRLNAVVQQIDNN